MPCYLARAAAMGRSMQSNQPFLHEFPASWPRAPHGDFRSQRRGVMTDLQQIRERLRTSATQESSPAGLLVWLIWSIMSVGAAVLAFAAVLYLLMPRFYPLQPSAAIPTFSETRSKVEAGAPRAQGVSAAQAAAIRTEPAALAGKSAADIGKIADEVCFRRAQARYPHWS